MKTTAINKLSLFKKSWVIGLLFTCFFCYESKAQTTVINPAPSLDAIDWKQLLEPPYFFNTGNAEQDALNYKTAKEEWIQKLVVAFESQLGPMEPAKREIFINQLRVIDFEAARAGDYTLPVLDNPYGSEFTQPQ